MILGQTNPRIKMATVTRESGIKTSLFAVYAGSKMETEVYSNNPHSVKMPPYLVWAASG